MPTEPVRVGACDSLPQSEPTGNSVPKDRPRLHEAYPPGVLPGPAGDDLVYIALGDSFASGEGAPGPDSCGDIEQVYVPGTATEGNHCHRSVTAYPVKLWERLERSDSRWSLDHRACSGATTRAFDAPQSFDERLYWDPWTEFPERANPPQWRTTTNQETPATTRPADLVTITMTGNDLGFADIVKDCVTDIYLDETQWWTFSQIDCSGERDGLIAEEAQEVRDRLANVYRSAREYLKGEDGRVLVAGYPRPFPASSRMPASCGVGAGVPMDADTMQWLNSVADQANAVVLAAARDAGVTYVDVADLLQDGDHTMCADVAGPEPGKRWMNRVIPTHMEWSAHPNQYMNDAYAARLFDCLGEARGQYCRPPLQRGQVSRQMIPGPWDDYRSATVRPAALLRLPGSCDEFDYPSAEAAAIRPVAFGSYEVKEDPSYGQVYVLVRPVSENERNDIRAYLSAPPPPCAGGTTLRTSIATFQPVPPAEPPAGEARAEFVEQSTRTAGTYIQRADKTTSYVLAGDYLIMASYVYGTYNTSTEERARLFRQEWTERIHPHLASVIPGF